MMIELGKKRVMKGARVNVGTGYSHRENKKECGMEINKE